MACPATAGSFSLRLGPAIPSSASLASQRSEIHGDQGGPFDSAVPWERAYVERVIGTIRREFLDHVIVFNQASLYRHVKSFLAHYHESRTHLSLAKDSPEPRPVHSAECGAVVAIPQVFGLHHQYERRADLNWRSSPRRRSCPGVARSAPYCNEATGHASPVGPGIVPSSRRNAQPVPAPLEARWDLR
jgi:hypothetical protein